MNSRIIYDILEKLKAGSIDVDAAMKALKNLPFLEMEYAKLDLGRQLRNGFPEVVYGEGKAPDHIAEIAFQLKSHDQSVLITRLSPSAFEIISKRCPFLDYREIARCAVWKAADEDLGRGLILVVSAGTSDLPVAGEAAVTAEIMGNRVRQINDIGVAGLHRLLAHRDEIRSAEVIVAVAGMEGALPRVISGLVDKPVIAVPTSVGYGASFKGLAALLGMLNSCASGVTVVNIDNGFGAGYSAALINRKHTS